MGGLELYAWLALRIRTPLFIVQGLNDPRVPYTESEQMLEAVMFGQKGFQTVIQAIITAARTGEIGDGRVFVTPITHSFKIRTGEQEK